MKIKNLIFFTLISVILSGLTTIVFVSVFDKEETTRLFDQNQVKVPETYSAASISEGTILLLLAVGVIGVLGVSRKDIANPAQEKELNRAPDHQYLNE
jgi:preprotein translocase subunit SecY